MITDQKQSGVPSATRGRLQLIKPVQTMNSGSTMKSNAVGDRQIPEQTTASRLSLQPKSESTISTQGATTQTANGTPQDASATIRRPFTPASSMSPALASSQQIARPTYQDTVDNLGKEFGNLTESDQLRFLNNIANGAYKSTSPAGLQSSALGKSSLDAQSQAATPTTVTPATPITPVTEVNR